MINMLYWNGFLQITPDHTAETFWESFEHSLSLNKRGVNGNKELFQLLLIIFLIKNYSQPSIIAHPLGPGISVHLERVCIYKIMRSRDLYIK